MFLKFSKLDEPLDRLVQFFIYNLQFTVVLISIVQSESNNFIQIIISTLTKSCMFTRICFRNNIIGAQKRCIHVQ